MRTGQIWRVLFISISFHIILDSQVKAQTCCTGSAPITGSIRISSIASKQWNLNIIADHNNMSDLYLDDSEVDEELITRATNTVLLQTNYGFSDRLSLSLVVPVVNKWEATNDNKVSKTAIGDASLLAQYSVVNKNNFSIIAGGGVKFPTGSTKRGENRHNYSAFASTRHWFFRLPILNTISILILLSPLTFNCPIFFLSNCRN